VRLAWAASLAAGSEGIFWDFFWVLFWSIRGYLFAFFRLTVGFFWVVSVFWTSFDWFFWSKLAAPPLSLGIWPEKLSFGDRLWNLLL